MFSCGLLLFIVLFCFVLLIFIFTLFCFTVLFWFCHTLTWISHGCTWVPNPEPPSHLSPHNISLDHLRAPVPSILYPVSNIDWRFVSYMILYMFQCHSPKSSHPLPFPQSPKDCSIHLCLFCCLAYRVIVTIFLNSIYNALVYCIGEGVQRWGEAIFFLYYISGKKHLNINSVSSTNITF